MPRPERNVVDPNGNKFRVRQAHPDGSRTVTPSGTSQRISAEDFKKWKVDEKPQPSPGVKIKPSKSVPARP